MGVLITLAALAGLLFSVSSFADSQARIVRLSYVEGDVQIDRNAGQGFEKAFLNLPVIQGTRLRAGSNGFAEVEFEDGSTLRLTSGTQVSFPQLGLRDSGAKVSSVDLLRGMVYVSFAGAKDNEFALTFGPETVALTTPVHLRLAVGNAKALLSVFKGDVQINSPSGVATAGKKETLAFNLADQGKYTLAKKIEESPYDSWDKEQNDYRQRYAQKSALTNSTNTYGLSDLNYYGNFFNVAGYGMMWQPFFAGAGWNPFMDGAWAWYPGAGYSWVSAYPWGWAPYHSGAWQFLPTYGWVWQPGGAWTGLNNIPQPIISPAGFTVPRPPATPVRSVIMVNRGTAAAPVAVTGRMVIRNNSAGLGIPRGSIQNLGRTSNHAQQHGFATATFRTPPAAAATYHPAAGGPASAASSRQPSSPGSAAGNYPSASSRPSMAPSPTFHGAASPASGSSRGASGTGK
jgi:hypothetical protein